MQCLLSPHHHSHLRHPHTALLSDRYSANNPLLSDLHSATNPLLSDGYYATNPLLSDGYSATNPLPTVPSDRYSATILPLLLDSNSDTNECGYSSAVGPGSMHRVQSRAHRQEKLSQGRGVRGKQQANLLLGVVGIPQPHRIGALSLVAGLCFGFPRRNPTSASPHLVTPRGVPCNGTGVENAWPCSKRNRFSR